MGELIFLVQPWLGSSAVFALASAALAGAYHLRSIHLILHFIAGFLLLAAFIGSQVHLDGLAEQKHRLDGSIRFTFAQFTMTVCFALQTIGWVLAITGALMQATLISSQSNAGPFASPLSPSESIFDE